MSDNMDDLLGDEQTSEQPSGKDLRRQLEEALKREKELKEKFEAIDREKRQAELSSKVSELQLDLNLVQALNPSILDQSAEERDKWLATFAEARGVTPAQQTQETPQQEQTNATPEGLTPQDVAQLHSIQTHQTGTAAVPSEASAQLASIESKDDFWSFIRSQGGDA